MTEMPHVEIGADSPVHGDEHHFGIVDFRIERYPLPPDAKAKLLHAFHSTGFVAPVNAHGHRAFLYFSPSGQLKVATPEQTRTLPHLPDDWEDYMLNVEESRSLMERGTAKTKPAIPAAKPPAKKLAQKKPAPKKPAAKPQQPAPAQPAPAQPAAPKQPASQPKPGQEKKDGPGRPGYKVGTIRKWGSKEMVKTQDGWVSAAHKDAHAAVKQGGSLAGAFRVGVRQGQAAHKNRVKTLKKGFKAATAAPGQAKKQVQRQTVNVKQQAQRAAHIAKGFIKSPKARKAAIDYAKQSLGKTVKYAAQGLKDFGLDKPPSPKQKKAVVGAAGKMAAKSIWDTLAKAGMPPRARKQKANGILRKVLGRVKQVFSLAESLGEGIGYGSMQYMFEDDSAESDLLLKLKAATNDDDALAALHDFIAQEVEKELESEGDDDQDSDQQKDGDQDQEIPDSKLFTSHPFGEVPEF